MYIVNINPLQTWVETDDNPPGHTPGTRAVDDQGQEYLCVKAGAAIGAYDFCICSNAGYSAQPITKTLLDADLASHCGIPRVDIASGRFGWLQIFGFTQCSVLASAAANVALYTSATAGALDDDSASQTQVYGIQLTTAAGTAAEDAPCALRYPCGVA